MKRIISSLLAGLLVTSFAQAAGTYMADSTTYKKQQTGYVSDSITASQAEKMGYARNYQGTWNANWSHPEWGYYHEIWGTASTLNILSDPSSPYETQKTFKY